MTLAHKPNALFCRILLKQAMLDLTGREAADFRANVGCTRMHERGWYLVEWPAMDSNGEMFHYEVQADNANHAKAQAINNWLEYHAPVARARTVGA